MPRATPRVPHALSPLVPNPRVSRRTTLRGFGAAFASLAVSGIAPAATRAQDTAAATPAAGSNPEITYFVQYIHPEKAYSWLPGMTDETVRAGFYGLDVETYEAILAEFATEARDAATELLADDAFAAQVDQLPFERNAVVAVLGESDTDSLQSWFEIVRQLIALRRPDDGIQLVNSGISGFTTTQSFSPLVVLLGQQPDWICCALGANDAVRIGPEPNKTLVSLDETTRNLAELHRLADLTTGAQWVWLTRMPIDETRMAAYAPFHMGPVDSVWRNADLEAINTWIRAQPEPVIDIYAAFGNPASPELQEPDGLHPSLAGHKVLAREFVSRLAASSLTSSASAATPQVGG